MAGHGPGMGAPGGGGVTGGGGGGGREVNTIQLCKMGQETVQEIVAKTTDIFNILKGYMQHPNSNMVAMPPQNHTDKQAKLQENYNNINVLFKKLRLLYDKCNQVCGGMEQNLTEDLIPWKDMPDKLKDMMLPGSQERLQVITNERQELVERVRAKNRKLRQIMDQLRALIWDINSMISGDSQEGQETSSIPHGHMSQPPQPTGPPHQGPPHQGPPHQGPPHQGPPHQGPPHQGPPHQGPPHQGPPHQGPPHQGPPHQGPPHQGPLHQGPPHQGPPHQGHPGPPMSRPFP